MITDAECNYLYLADTLPTMYPDFYGKLLKAIEQLNIPLMPLLGTKDVWAKDFMPIQIVPDKFVQFIYDPSYLKPEKYAASKSNPDKICKEVGVDALPVDIKIDGGNVVKWKNKAIITTRIFQENPDIPKNDLIEKVKAYLEIDELIIVPAQPYDFTGHADGMIRFIDENRVFINDISGYSRSYHAKLLRSIHKAGLQYIQLPINYSRLKTPDSAVGCYINYLEMEQGIIISSYGFFREDQIAMGIFKKIFPDRKIIAVDCNEIAEQGGMLNCVSWGIYK